MFESSYRHWHKYATIPELCLSEHSHPKVMIPSYLSQQQPNESLTLDIVLAGDWTRFGGPQKSMLEEINALLKHGFTVGIMSLEAGRFMENIPRPLCEAVQELINNGQ